MKYLIVLLAMISFTGSALGQSSAPQNEERFTQRNPTVDPSGNRVRPKASIDLVSTRSRDAAGESSKGETSSETQSTPSGSPGTAKIKSTD